MPEIKGDYQGKLKTIKATSDAKLETVSAIEAGSAIIGNIDRVGTIGDITHLGSIGNVSFDQGAVSEHKRHMYMNSSGTWIRVGGDPIGLYTRPFFHDNGGYAQPHLGDYGQLRTACAWDGAEWVSLAVDSNWRLRTAPATTRKGVVQTVANAGTAVALVASSTPAIGVIVKAVHDNLGTIYVGDSTVDNTHGFQLRRDEFISFSCQNAGSVYIDASRDNQKVSALYINY